MDDLISRAAAIEGIDAMLRYYDEKTSPLHRRILTDIREGLNEIPAVDAVPVVHGRWINYPECLGYDGAYTDEHIVCSACHSVWNIIDNNADRFDYCPTCGAKMDGERRDGE